MSKKGILDFFNDINFAYNNSGMHDSLSIMLDELVQESRNKVIDEFAERLKNHLNEFDFWKYGISDGTNYETRNYDHMIDKIAEQMKGE